MSDPKTNTLPKGSKVVSPAPNNKKPHNYPLLNRQLNKLTGEAHLIFVPGYN